ncbi:MAG: hypothetical protein HY529_06155 [Chloroflexi bacterium]|nr:hypothetical protein [Chloroflexota bacterium]
MVLSQLAKGILRHTIDALDIIVDSNVPWICPPEEGKMMSQLLSKMDESDRDGVEALIRDEIAAKGQAWTIHQALFPLTQRVMNPPYINPHLPKMYRICREFLPYLAEDEIPALVRLEINEYTRRPKLKELPKNPRRVPSVTFPKIETAIRGGNAEEVAILLISFLEQRGAAELSRNLLLLGSGYLGNSLGHSVSCTGFILLEMMERSDQDSWPVLATLADYFCKGHFDTTPALRKNEAPLSEKALGEHLLRATSGNGILNLHHTITRYAIERIRHLLSEAEYAHMLNCWIKFMGDKTAEAPSPILSTKGIPDYKNFYQIFAKRAEEPLLACLTGMISSKEGRQQLGHHLIKGICDLYQGDYDPHFLTGLGATLWVIDRYHKQTPIAINALRQYLNYFL